MILTRWSRGAKSVGKQSIRRILLSAFNVRCIWGEGAIQALNQPAVLVTANHVSLLDGPLISLASPVPMVFAIDTDFSRGSALVRCGISLLAKLGGHDSVPLDVAAPFGMRQLLTALREGRNVMLFPEGRISDGSPLPNQPGVDWLVARVASKQVHITIRGAEHSRFFAKSGQCVRPAITLEFSVR